MLQIELRCERDGPVPDIGQNGENEIVHAEVQFGSSNHLAIGRFDLESTVVHGHGADIGGNGRRAIGGRCRVVNSANVTRLGLGIDRSRGDCCDGGHQGGNRSDSPLAHLIYLD
ncbi:hypothetical protein VMT65_28985 [Nocardia sp. CDC153]|uniref:hypothetical protein n=1 Tax=Nocardia sp. CDC153 TaxID=3112167 RepID=UPI002DBCA23E|nr:hypothetical protein [Nocardia sp. CDC153]MEC3957102.1 hypothetical protein [Nocardia sp. CDC153]